MTDRKTPLEEPLEEKQEIAWATRCHASEICICADLEHLHRCPYWMKVDLHECYLHYFLLTLS